MKQDDSPAPASSSDPPAGEGGSAALHQLEGLPSPAARRWILGGCMLFLLSQIWIPASYYFQPELTSERFSWRMFSSVDLASWQTEVIAVIEQADGKVVEQTVALPAELQESHAKTVERGQLDIVEPFLHRLVARPGVQEVRYRAEGTWPGGEKMPPIQLTLRPGGQIERP